MCRPVQEAQTLSARQRLEQKLEAAGLQLVVQKTFVHCQVVGASAPALREETQGSSRRARSDSSRFFETASQLERFCSDSDLVVELPQAVSPERRARLEISCQDVVAEVDAEAEVTDYEWPAAPQPPAGVLSVVTEDEWFLAPRRTARALATPPPAAPGAFARAVPQPRAPRTTRTKRSRGEAKERTTLMFKNLPSSYLRPDVMTLLDEAGFACQYNFVHVPVDCFSGSGLGYGFINTSSEDVAERLMEKLQGFTSWNARSSKVLEVCWGAEQGLRPLVARYRNSRMMHASVPEAYRPMLFSEGAPVAFPTPTKKILKPRCVAASHLKQRSSTSAVIPLP